jgi:hypothetical protein
MSNNPNAYTTPETFDTNIDNYSLSELLTIFNLSEQPTSQEIIENTNQYIEQANQSNNTSLAQFCQESQNILLQYIQGDPSTEDNVYEPGEQQNLTWWNNEEIPQPDPNQNSKITNRVQQIGIFGNDHVPMNRNQLGVNNNFNVSVAQDTLNPNLTNTTTRFINLDSQFRQSTSGIESSSTDYTLDLSEPLNNVLSMKLYSIQIPHTWYTYDTNTCFWILFKENVYCKISIQPGNYTAPEIVEQLNNYLSSSQFTWIQPISVNYPISYNPNSGKITMNLFHGIYIDPITKQPFLMRETTKILFFDINNQYHCENNNCFQQNKINQTFGWNLGYRLPYVYISPNGNKAETIVNTFGPKYLIIVIEDYNQNHINNGLITITEASTTIKLPSYYDPTTPVKCLQPLQQNKLDMNTNSLLYLDKTTISYKKIPQVLPTAPRILTQAQIYSINEIQKNNESNTSLRGKAPTNPDIFALLPVKLNNSESTSTGSYFVEFSGSLQENKRVYFGPVNIERMRIKLLDDKGNILNLNGADWSVTLICDLLYQY